MKPQLRTLVTILLVAACLILMTSCIQSTEPDPSKTEAPKQTQPKSPDVDTIIQTGIAQLEAGNLAKAIASFKKATKLAPNNLKAAKYLQDTEAQRDEMVEKALRKGIAHFEDDELEAAMTQWEKVLELDPSHKKAHDYKERTQIRLDALK